MSIKSNFNQKNTQNNMKLSCAKAGLRTTLSYIKDHVVAIKPQTA